MITYYMNILMILKCFVNLSVILSIFLAKRRDVRPVAKMHLNAKVSFDCPLVNSHKVNTTHTGDSMVGSRAEENAVYYFDRYR